MKVALVGCGQIASYHARFLRAIECADVAGVCDRDRFRAEQIASMAGGARAYCDYASMLEEVRPDVVHVLTPPATHHHLALQAIEKGCHVLVEKPMALSVQEADSMIRAAERHGVTLCANHNYLFGPSIQKARRLIREGAIGNTVYVNSFYGISGEGGDYRDTAGRSHWAWRLPGGAFTNFLPHLIYLQLAFLPQLDEVAGVHVAQEKGGAPPTELSVLLAGPGVTGMMTFSMRAKPYAKFLEIYGTRGILHADLVRENTTIHKYRRMPGMASKVLFNLETSLQLSSSTLANVLKVALGRMTSMTGLRNLLHAFYESLQSKSDPPVTGQEGWRTAQIMERIWSKADERALRLSPVLAARSRSGPETEVERKIAAQRLLAGSALVTGATGFLGSNLAAALARCGMDVTAMARDPDRVSPRLKQGARVVYGDLRDPASLAESMRSADYVFHCAAITTNKAPWKDYEQINIQGTRAVFDSALRHGAKRVVLASSVTVYGIDRSNGKAVNESEPYAFTMDRWAYYLRSKLEADKMAIGYHERQKLPVTVLRFGILYGPGAERSPGRGLFQLGSTHLLIGNGRNRLPYTFIKNAVDAMLLAAVSTEAIGRAFNIVDQPQVDLRRVIAMRSQLTGESPRIVPISPLLLFSAARLLEWRQWYKGADRPPGLSRFVIRSARRDIQYDTSQARDILGWHPEVSLEEGLKQTLSDGNDS